MMEFVKTKLQVNNQFLATTSRVESGKCIVDMVDAADGTSVSAALAAQGYGRKRAAVAPVMAAPPPPTPVATVAPTPAPARNRASHGLVYA